MWNLAHLLALAAAIGLALTLAALGPEARRLREKRRAEQARRRQAQIAQRAEAEALARWRKTRGRLRMAGHDPDLAGPLRVAPDVASVDPRVTPTSEAR